MEEFEKEAWNELTKDVLIASGFGLSVHSMIDINCMNVVDSCKYREDSGEYEMLENTGKAKAANQTAFPAAPQKLPHNHWQH